MGRPVLTLLFAVCAVPVFAQQAAPPAPKAEVYVGYQDRRDLSEAGRYLSPPGRGDGLRISFDWVGARSR